jgi:DNA ligase-4
MKLGLGQIAILNAFHPDAKGLYDVNANLRKVCELLRDPSKRMNEIEVQLFNPFRPMLADRGVMKEVEKQMGEKEFYVEVKYDGERMQVHKEGSKFQFFSRNGFDFTDDFGSSPSASPGMFCSFLADSLAPSVKSVILDGEICAFNHQTDTLCQKGEQMNIRALAPDDAMFHQCLYIYDIVYLNGKVLTNKPLRDRIALVESIVKPLDGRVQFAERKTGKTKGDVVDALNLAIDRREEGIVLKDPESVYKPNVRSRGGWLKIKPEYSNSLMDQCDLIVMGGYYGSGKRGGIITHFLLGLEDRSVDADGPRVYHSFCRVGSGYSMKELNELLKKLQKNFKRGRPPPDAAFVYEFGREKPDVTIDPKNSVILQVKAAEIISSDQYKAGFTLR